jgi:hypothetical protein
LARLPGYPLADTPSIKARRAAVVERMADRFGRRLGRLL